MDGQGFESSYPSSSMKTNHKRLFLVLLAVRPGAGGGGEHKCFYVSIFAVKRAAFAMSFTCGKLLEGKRVSDGVKGSPVGRQVQRGEDVSP